MNEPPRFLDRPVNQKRIRWTFYALCAVLAGLDLVIHRHAEHPWEGLFGFHAIYGFVACVVLVLAAKQMRRALMRREDYYEGRPEGRPRRGPPATGKEDDA